jgi:hypothetical protein
MTKAQIVAAILQSKATTPVAVCMKEAARDVR